MKKMKMSEKMGMEEEYTRSKCRQKKIVQEHEKEHGTAYYPALKGLETRLKAGETMAKSKAHPGFKAVQNKIAKKQGVSKKAAGAILANSARNASKAAKKANPRLKKVKG